MSGSTEDDSDKMSMHSNEDDELSSTVHSAKTGDGSTDIQKKKPADDLDTVFLKRSKLCVLGLLCVLAAGAGAITYIYASDNQNQAFGIEVNTRAFEIEEGVLHKSNNLIGMMESMAMALSTQAQTTEQDWPFETFPDFESLAAQYRNVSGTQKIMTAPLVTSLQQKMLWEQYSAVNQGWIKESYDTVGVNVEPLDIPEHIYEHQEGLATEALSSPFLPLWQISSPPKTTSVVNFNLLSNEAFSTAFEIAQSSQQSLLTEMFDIGDILSEDSEGAPDSLLIQPVYDNAMAADRKVVATVAAVVNWEDFLSEMVPEGVKGMRVVLENTCGQVYTFDIDGVEAIYLGEGDFHDAAYDEWGLTAELIPSSTIPSDTDGYCMYSIAIYPQDIKQNKAAPIGFTVVMVLIFFLAGIGFLVYDHLVQKRQKEAMENAARSDAIVSSLFPEEIRDRLFKGEGVSGDDEAAMKKAVIDHEKKQTNNPEAQKFRLKNFLAEEDQPHQGPDGKHVDATMPQSKPIADLFPNTTVLFADISGFTAWSSVREPSQVFTLLETVYKAFDKTAKRRRVFKVETVGDCYVAVTGLPEPIKDHALVMCRFARECLTQFNELSTQLEVLLGPDTGDLAIRVGIHSGPVTAGVLRGDKSRFQLFGDTVNTAARIESTGQRNRIHLSHETAEFVHQAGKSTWLRKRTETINAKGKGEMQTYWLLTDEELASGTSVDESKASAPLPIVKAVQARIGKGDMDDPESMLPPRIKRLVDWNVDVLKRLLKQIVAKRMASSAVTYDLNHPVMMKEEVNIGCDTYVLDEVTEIIRLPGYTHDKFEGNINKIELPKEVEEQLRLYVSSVAAMHRDNPFHNFEHASHVMMSVSKLLSRIIAPDEVLKDETQDKYALSLHDHTYGITSDPLTQFSVVLAALIHDVDHAGVSNFQLIKENAKIATVFKNKSVAEQNSIVIAWDRLMESKFAALRGHIYGTPDELKRFRQLMVNTVLATDIFDKELQTLRKNRWDKAFRDMTEAGDSTPEDDVNRKATIVIEHLIQASDVAHTMQHWHIYQKWNERLFAEMTAAFQSGRMGSDPSSGWYQGELGFFDNYVIPLAKKLKECGVFGVSSDEYLNYALENRREWASKGEDAVKKMVDQYCKKPEEPVEAPKTPVEAPPNEAEA